MRRRRGGILLCTHLAGLKAQQNSQALCQSPQHSSGCKRTQRSGRQQRLQYKRGAATVEDYVFTVLTHFYACSQGHAGTGETLGSTLLSTHTHTHTPIGLGPACHTLGAGYPKVDPSSATTTKRTDFCAHTLSLGCDTVHCKLCTSKTLRGKRVSGFVKSLKWLHECCWAHHW